VLYGPNWSFYEGMPCRSPYASWKDGGLKIDDFSGSPRIYNNIVVQEEGYCQIILDDIEEEKIQFDDYLGVVYPLSWGVCFKSTMTYQKSS